jgi:hypothetical protein
MARMPNEITVNLRLNTRGAHEQVERLRRIMSAMGMITPPRTVLEQVGDHGTDHLVFDYVNWRGEDHRYEIEVEGMTYDVHGGTSGDADLCWQINGHVILRDGVPRPEMGDNTRRSFKLTDMKNITQVKSPDTDEPLSLDTLGPTEV